MIGHDTRVVLLVREVNLSLHGVTSTTKHPERKHFQRTETLTLTLIIFMNYWKLK
jgi:hypothetical protein